MYSGRDAAVGPPSPTGDAPLAARARDGTRPPAAASRPDAQSAFDIGIARRFYLAIGLNGLFFGLEASALPLYLLGFGLAPALYGLLAGCAFLVSLISRGAIAALALRVGNRPLVAAGCGAFAVLSWALLLPGGVPLLFVVRALNGIARALIAQSLRAWFTELCPRPALPSHLGQLNASFAVGQSLIGLLASPLLFAWLGPVGLLGLIGLLPLLLWVVLRPAPADNPEASARAAAGSATPRLLWPVALCSVCGGSLVTAMATFVPLIVTERGWPIAVVGVVLFAHGLGTVLGARFNGLLVARRGEAVPVLGGLTLAVIAAVTLYELPDEAVLLAVALVSGVASGSLTTLSMGFAARALASRSAGIAWRETFISIGYGAGGVLGGLATTWLGTPRAALLPAVPLALATALAIVLVRQHLLSATRAAR